MGKSNFIMICISLVALMVLVTFGITYSYFSSTSINGKSTSNIDLTSGKMIINFTDKNPNIVFSNVIPGPTTSVSDAILNKSFVISGTNTTDLKMEYKLNLVVKTNEFENNDIGYILVGKNNNNGSLVTNAKTAFSSSSISKINKGTNLTINLGTGYFTKSADQINHEYTLYMFFIETNKEQNVNCNFKAYLGLII